MIWKKIGLIILCCIMTAYALAELSGSLEEEEIIKRIQAEGQVTVEKVEGAAQESTVLIADIGKHRYEQTCKLCHETGLADSPKFGDKAEWKPRIAQGMETLIKHALIGLKAMPPKGGCGSCSDDEIKAAVEYIVKHSQ